MICLELNWFFYGLSRMLQFSEFVWALSYSVWDVFNNFLQVFNDKGISDHSFFSSKNKDFSSRIIQIDQTSSWMDIVMNQKRTSIKITYTVHLSCPALGVWLSHTVPLRCPILGVWLYPLYGAGRPGEDEVDYSSRFPK